MAGGAGKAAQPVAVLVRGRTPEHRAAHPEQRIVTDGAELGGIPPELLHLADGATPGARHICHHATSSSGHSRRSATITSNVNPAGISSRSNATKSCSGTQ